MARIRTIKPEFCSSTDTGALSRDARLFFLQLLTEADDEGRLLWLPRRICGVLYPFDEDVGGKELDDWARECEARNMVQIYTIDNVRYLAITNWDKHQRINRATASKLPGPDSAHHHDELRTGSLLPHCGLTEDVHREQGTGNREQGRGTGNRDSEATASPAGGGDICQRVVDVYHRLLPDCQRMNVITDKRRRRILAVDKEARKVCKQQGWSYDPETFWAAYFARCALDPWMAGKVANPRNPKWKQHLECLLGDDRFGRVMDEALDDLNKGGA